MMSRNVQPNYFDVWYFSSYMYDVNRLKTTIGQRIREHNKDSELEVKKKLFLQKKKYHPKKQLTESFIQTADTQFELLKLPKILCFEILSVFWIIVSVVISSETELMKQRWFLLARKVSQTESFLAN